MLVVPALFLFFLNEAGKNEREKDMYAEQLRL